MATVSIFTRKKIPNKIQELTIDTSLTEEHRYENNVTDYPIEDGTNINDHINRQPEEITIEGVITATPFEQEDDIIFDDSSDRVANYYNKLIEYLGIEPTKPAGALNKNKVYEPVLLDIVTGLKTFTSMACTSLIVPVSTRNALNFTAKFKKVKKVSAKIGFVPKVSNLGGQAPNIENQAGKTVNAGNQSTENVSPVSSLYNALFGEAPKIEIIKSGEVQ